MLCFSEDDEQLVRELTNKPNESTELQSRDTEQ